LTIPREKERIEKSWEIIYLIFDDKDIPAKKILPIFKELSGIDLKVLS
jgi:hypothetical protein